MSGKPRAKPKAVSATNIKIEVVEVDKKTRKTKTGKVVVQPVETAEPLLNVILHLKCS